LEHRIEGAHKLGILVVDQEMDRRFAVLQFPNHLARLLRHPGRIGMTGAASQVDAPRVQLDEEEHIHGLQEKAIDREKIAGQDLFLVVRHQVPPAD
jgi:hypothetical protein